jgi:hypothetical protein
VGIVFVSLSLLSPFEQARLCYDRIIPHHNSIYNIFILL